MRKSFIKKIVAYGTILLLCTGNLLADEFPFNPPKNFILNPSYIAVHHPVATNQV
jgi:hypothetical protein